MKSPVPFQYIVLVLFASFVGAATSGADPASPPAPGASQETRSITLAHASAVPLSEALSAMLKRNKPLVKITADRNANSLTVVGFGDDLQQVEALVQEFDVAAAPAASASALAASASQQTRIIPVRHNPVEPLAPGLQALFEESKPHVRITALKKTNSLIVAGEPDDIQQVETLVRQFDVSTSQIEIQAHFIETETTADGNPEAHLNPGMENLKSGSGGAAGGSGPSSGAPGIHLTVLNGQAGIFQMGEAGGFAGRQSEPATASGGYLAIPGIESLPRKMVGTGHSLDLTAYEFGGQVALVGVMTFTPEARTTAVENASGMAVVTQPVQVHFAVKIADPETPCTIGPFESGPGRTLKIKLKAVVMDDAAGGQAASKAAGQAPQGGATVGIEKKPGR